MLNTIKRNMSGFWNMIIQYQVYKIVMLKLEIRHLIIKEVENFFY